MAINRIQSFGPDGSIPFRYHQYCSQTAEDTTTGLIPLAMHLTLPSKLSWAKPDRPRYNDGWRRLKEDGGIEWEPLLAKHEHPADDSEISAAPTSHVTKGHNVDTVFSIQPRTGGVGNAGTNEQARNALSPRSSITPRRNNARASSKGRGGGVSGHRSASAPRGNNSTTSARSAERREDDVSTPCSSDVPRDDAAASKVHIGRRGGGGGGGKTAPPHRRSDYGPLKNAPGADARGSGSRNGRSAAKRSGSTSAATVGLKRNEVIPTPKGRSRGGGGGCAPATAPRRSDASRGAGAVVAADAARGHGDAAGRKADERHGDVRASPRSRGDAWPPRRGGDDDAARQLRGRGGSASTTPRQSNKPRNAGAVGVQGPHRGRAGASSTAATRPESGGSAEQSLLQHSSVRVHRNQDGYTPRPSQRVSRARSHHRKSASGDGDTWVEIIVVTNKIMKNGKRRNRSLFYSIQTRRARWDEPPSGASNVVLWRDLEKDAAGGVTCGGGRSVRRGPRRHSM